MAKTRTILGLGGSDHDVNACLVRGDTIVANIEEERITRLKYGLGGNLMHGYARAYCLATGGIALEDVDVVVADSILAPPALIGCRSRARPLDHHLLHAAASFFTSPFERAAILVVDNAGDLYVDSDGVELLQATTWYVGEGRHIERIGGVGSTEWVEGPPIAGRPYQRGDGIIRSATSTRRSPAISAFAFRAGARWRNTTSPRTGSRWGSPPTETRATWRSSGASPSSNRRGVSGSSSTTGGSMPASRPGSKRIRASRDVPRSPTRPRRRSRAFSATSSNT